MAIFEITLTNVGPLLWIDMLTTVVVLESYLGIVYITYATQGIYSAFFPHRFRFQKKKTLANLSQSLFLFSSSSSSF